RQKALLDSYRGNPTIATELLNQIIDRLDACFAALNAQTGKTGQSLTENDWLMAIRSRISIPGGTCGFDLPAYHAWQYLDTHVRQQALEGWTGSLTPLADALFVLLQMLRDTGVPQRVVAENGQFQQNLPTGRSFQLL